MARTVEQERYEAIFRAIGRPVRYGLLLCIGTSLLLAFAFGVSSGFLAPLLPDEWPRWLVFLVLMAPFGVAVILLPNLTQLLVINGKTLRAIEAVNAFGFGEAEEYTARARRKPPILANADKARAWLQRGEGYGTRVRTRILIWAGELPAAAEVIAAMPVTSPADAFHRSLLRQLVAYVATGSMDLSDARAALVRIPASRDRDHALVALAFEEARLDLDRGNDFLRRLADVREGLTDLPRGASIGDRFIANLPSSIGTFAIIATLIWVVRS
jgi:hypothetical protein